MWPSYWSVLNTEHITPEGDRLDQFIEYHHELQAETILSNCTVRVTPDQELAVALAGADSVDLDHADAPFPVRVVHDTWVRCDYVLTNSLAQRLEGPSAVMRGQLSFGLNEAFEHWGCSQTDPYSSCSPAPVRCPKGAPKTSSCPT